MMHLMSVRWVLDVRVEISPSPDEEPIIARRLVNLFTKVLAGGGYYLADSITVVPRHIRGSGIKPKRAYSMMLDLPEVWTT
jgi:hypothetical protein